MNELDGARLPDKVLEDALREHYRAESAAVDFPPIDTRSLSRRGPGRPGWWWLAAAACVVVVAGVLVVPRVLDQRPVPASPAPTPPPATASTTAGPTPSTTPSFAGGGGWAWVERPDVPTRGVRLAAGYLTVVLDGVDYYLAEPAPGGTDCPPLRGYRYLRAAAIWEELPIDPALTGDLCQGAALYAGGDAVYARVEGRGGPPEASYRVDGFLRFDPRAGAWQRLPDLPGEPGAFQYGSCTGLDTGVFCYAYDVTRGGATGAYALLEFATGQWRSGHSDDLAALDFSSAYELSGVTIGGRPTVLMLSIGEVNRADQAGEVRAVLLDPATGAVTLRASGRATYLWTRQLVAPGFVYFGPHNVRDEGTTATLLDLRSGAWRSLEVPRPTTGADRTRDQLTSADWGRRVYGSEAAGYAVIRDYLYDPVADRWLLLPVVDVSPPWIDLPQEPETEGDPFDELWLGPSPSQCAFGELGPCYELRADPLSEVGRELTRDEVMAGSTVR